MEFFTSMSLLSAIIACLLVIFIIPQIIIDVKEIKTSQILRNELISIAKKHVQKSISVIIELSGSAEDIYPLLDHLYAHEYDKLEVIIFIKKSANKNASALITNYRRINNITQLKIIRDNKVMTLDDVLLRHCSGSLVVLLTPTERLSDNFFIEASVAALNTVNAIVALPRLHIRIEKTIASAIQAQKMIFRQLLSQFFPINMPLWPLRNGVVYDRKTIILNNYQLTSNRIFVNQRLYISDIARHKTIMKYVLNAVKRASQALRSALAIGWFVFIIGFIVASIIVFDTGELLLLMLVVISLYILTSVLIQIHLRGYSLMDHINLILITPFGFIIMLVAYLLGFIRLLVGIIQPHRKRV